MPIYSLEKINSIVEGRFSGDKNINISYLVTDSRTLFSPNDALFFAIVGERHDGHKFIPELYNKKSLKNFVVQYLDPSFSELPGINIILVDDTLKAMQNLANAHRKTFPGTVIGITGSNGKTIVKEWLYQLMHGKKNIVRSPKSFNSQIGVPLSIWNIENTAEIALIEAGISKEGEMIKLQQMVAPNIGIFTNIGEAHQENFLSFQRKTREKLILFRDCPTIIYCSDHDYIEEEIHDWANSDQKLISWSTKKSATLKIDSIKKTNIRTYITGLYKNKSISIEIPFTDGASVENAIHCWVLMLHLDFQQSYIETVMKELSPVAMRLELKKGINNCTLINDSYNSDIYSLGIALDFLNQQQQHVQKTVILSDILQSGKEEDDLCKEIAQLISRKKIQRFIGIGKSLFTHAGIFEGQKEFFLSTDDFINNYHPSLFQNEAILLKGARSFEFERISSLIEQKSHRTTLEINLSAMVHNLNYFRSKLKPSTKTIVMVKAFSYGSGTYEIANMLEYQKVDYLAVAFADEGVALRKAGIGLPIIVMNPEENGFRQMIDHQLEPEIYSFAELKKFLAVLKILQAKNYPIHIKLDTGMHRLGFMPDELDRLRELLEYNHEYINIKSVFSHLAGSDEEEHDDFTNLQADEFDSMCNILLKNYPNPVLKHLANSMGIERFPQYQYDMVRLGIGLYGVNPFNQDLLRPVSFLRTTILQIKTIKAGETVGYNRKGKVPIEKVIAIIPVGYADGFSRLLGNGKGHVFVKGVKAPLIGNVCMDMSMIDITGIDTYEGDEVEIFGENITIQELAEKMGTIPYEVLTGIAQRVKRVYIQD